MNTPRSSIPDIVWPAIPSSAGAMLMALQFQFEQSQWWPTETLQQLQWRQIEALLRHAYDHVPYYRRVLNNVGLNPTQPLTADRLARLPLLHRDQIMTGSDELTSKNVGREHGRHYLKSTSGSTGKPLQIKDTEANGLFWYALTLRDHLWHGRDIGGRFVAIRSGRSAKDPHAVKDLKTWGPSSGRVYDTGPMTMFFHLTPIERQAQLLQSRDPHYLLTYPSNAVSLARYFSDQNLKLPNLRQVQTYGEPIGPEVRRACREAWGASVADMYSAEEVGYIALQCPQHEHYHVQAESLMVEVLDDDDRPCAPGQIGRVVLTTLHNFAMPLIRYANDDYAEVGEPCSCGRGLPVIKRILGRRRNMAVRPDQSRFWPSLPPQLLSTIPGVRQIQLCQRTAQDVDVRVASTQPLQDADEQALSEMLRSAMGSELQFSFSRHDQIPRHANGKLEPFICQVVKTDS